MKIEGSWYSDIAVTEKIDGIPVALSIGVSRADRTYSVKGINFGDAPGGFGEWAERNQSDLGRVLGPGMHRGVWWGRGIGRGYDISDRRFALYDFKLWDKDDPTQLDDLVDGMALAPVLYYGPSRPEHGQDPVAEALRRLQFAGSAAARGFKKPAGVIVTNLETGLHFSVDLD